MQPDKPLMMSLDEMRVAKEVRLYPFQIAGSPVTKDGEPIEIPDEDKPPTDAMVMLEVHHLGGGDDWDQPTVVRFIVDPGDMRQIAMAALVCEAGCAKLDRERN